MKPVIAVDGHSGSGKGTLSFGIARYFGFAYLDTGFLYRIAAFFKMEESVLESISVDDLLKKTKHMQQDVFRTEEVGAQASFIAKNPYIREQMCRMQREFAAQPSTCSGSVLDGRDIGTVVIPDATCKLFVTANLMERAKRRFATEKQYNLNASFKDVYDKLETRDLNDSSRIAAPLTCNESYNIINTSLLSIDGALQQAINIIEKVLAKADIKL